MSGKRKTVQHGMQGVFVFVLLGLFAVMSTLMVLLGAQMYRNTVDYAEQNNEDRVLSAYVRSMVRADDAAESVSVEEHEGVSGTLALRERIGEDEYVTWLYCYEGMLYEQFTSREDEFDPAGGTAICEAQSFEPRLEGSLLTVEMADGRGEPCEVRVALNCAQ